MQAQQRRLYKRRTESIFNNDNGEIRAHYHLRIPRLETDQPRVPEYAPHRSHRLSQGSHASLVDVIHRLMLKLKLHQRSTNDQLSQRGRWSCAHAYHSGAYPIFPSCLDRRLFYTMLVQCLSRGGLVDGCS
jgi:hypothetical protein